MKAFFADIFEYHHHFNQQLIDIFTENEELLTARSIPLFSHCLNAHQIWNERILNIPNTLDRFDEHALEQFSDMDHANYDTTLKILQEYAMDQQITYTNSKGGKFKNTLQEILFHIVNHFTHHKGQLISDLREADIEPPITDYIFYKR